MTFGSKHSLNSGLIHHWKLDESSGLVAKNSVNSSFDGALVGMVGDEWVDPFVDKGGLVKDGVNDTVNCGDISGIGGLSGFTACCYFSSAASPPVADEYIFAKRAASGGNRTFFINLEQTTGKIRARLWIDGSGDPVIPSTTVITTGVKYHVAITYTGNLFSLYINGALENSASTPETVMQSSTVPFHIGSRDAVDNFNGTTDDMRIYKRALSLEELETFTNRLLVA